MGGKHGFMTSIVKHETASAVGVLGFASGEALVADKGGLLVANEARDEQTRNVGMGRIDRAKVFRVRHDLGQ